MNIPNAAVRSYSAHKEVFRCTKTYDHTEGLSCCFRQWRAAHSHCRFLHGYALAFRFVFATHQLDENNWCFDFGGMKPIKDWLKTMFDHTLLIAQDDPELARFEALAADGLGDVRVLAAVGCEAVAKHVHEYVSDYLRDATASRVWLESVEVKEHGGNSAIYAIY